MAKESSQLLGSIHIKEVSLKTKGRVTVNRKTLSIKPYIKEGSREIGKMDMGSSFIRIKVVSN